MKTRGKIICWVLCSIIWAGNAARGQPIDLANKAKEYIDQDIQRHRWEINVNAGNIFNLGRSGTYQYYYLVKLNSRKVIKSTDGAWRFSLSPKVGNLKQFVPGDTSMFGSVLVTNYDIKPMFVLGYEWQKIRGRTALFGGIDLAGLLHWSRGAAPDATSPWEASVKGTSIVKFHTNMIWLSPFLGAKIYLNHRLSLSIESHLRFGYHVNGTKTWFEKRFVARSLLISKDIEPLPNYFIGISYNI